MVVEIKIFPRANLQSDLYKQLYQGITGWVYAPSAFGERSALSAGLDDLRDGDQPQIRYTQRLMEIEARGLPDDVREKHFPDRQPLSKEERHRLKQALGKDADSRHVALMISGTQARDRKGIVTSLRQFIDESLVADVLIDGITWDESFDFDLRLYRVSSHCCHIVPKAQATPDQLQRLGVAIEKMWLECFLRIRDCRILEVGLGDLGQGSLPDLIEQQFEDGNGEKWTESPTYAESQLRSVMFMLSKNLFPFNIILKILKERMPVECVEEIVIDESHFDLEQC